MERRLATAFVPFWLWACSNGDGGPSARGGPFFDGIFEAFGELCGACLRSSAPEGATGCEASASCRDSLRCLGSGRPWFECGLGRVDADPSLAAIAAPLGGACLEFCGGGRHWDCVGEFDWPEPMAASVQFRLAYRDILVQSEVPGLAVNACLASDPDCTAPLDSQTTTSSGMASMVFSASRTESVFLVAANASVDERRYWSMPPVFDREEELPVAATTDAELAALAIGLTPMNELGSLVALVTDCSSLPAPDVTIVVDTADGLSGTFYVQNNLPAQGLDATTRSGAAGVVNLPPGPAAVSIYHAGREVSRTRVDIRPRVLTWVHLSPSPRGD